MISEGIQAELFPFQENTVFQLLNIVSDPRTKKTVTLKSPTGSGKTILLIDFVSKFLSRTFIPTAFIWLCPGKGDLEEQSREKMRRYAPHLQTQTLLDALTTGFEPNTTTFVNWELVTNKNNLSLKEGERQNLFDRIASAHRANTDFIIIVDEEHSNNTAKANDILKAFAASHTIRVSATAKRNNLNEYIEIDETEVIEAGLIAKAIYVNEGFVKNMEINKEIDTLLSYADNKRKEIASRYNDMNINIRPLVLIQFPNAQPNTIEEVEEKLEEMGYTYKNKMVAKWLSEEKIGIDENFTNNDGEPVFLLMKQAISTGWDCPRAKILVKLRENMSETFEIQTIGRIRRMPELKHYDDDLLDFCYVYTFDDKYKEGLLSSVDKAYELKRLFLKDKCKTFSLVKETRDLDFDELGEREVLIKVYDSFKEKYKLGENKRMNKTLLQESGYIFGDIIYGHTIQGQFVHTEKLVEATANVVTEKKADTHADSREYLHCSDRIKRAVGMTNVKVRETLGRLFRNNIHDKYKFLELSPKEFYAFVINNVDKLLADFVEVTSSMQRQNVSIMPKTSNFHIPTQDFYKYIPNVKKEIEYLSNAYEKYTNAFTDGKLRSLCEKMFEKYCEKKEDIDWVYKNGDVGQQYFSIVYIDGLQKQHLFYADYIVKKKDGSVWIIETKGGELQGEDKNIDKQIENKFNAFKIYAERHELNWGFVRYGDTDLYINNTVYANEMSDRHWIPLENVL